LSTRYVLSFGQTFFEAELVNGHSKDVLTDSVGTVVEVDEQIPAESLSSAVDDGACHPTRAATVSNGGYQAKRCCLTPGA
jgi:hypothetical protein